MIWTDLSVLSGVTGEKRANVKPDKCIPIKKRRIKSLATSPLIKDPIPNQDKNTLGLKKYQSLPPQKPQYIHGFKSLRNEANDDNTENTDTSLTDKDDTSRTDRDDSVENVKVMRNKNDYDEYKEED